MPETGCSLVERPAEPDRSQHARLGRRELRRRRDHRHADLREERLDGRRAALATGGVAAVRHRAPHAQGAAGHARRRQLSSGAVPLLSPGSANYGYRAGPTFKHAARRAPRRSGTPGGSSARGSPTSATATASLARNYPGMKDYLTTWLPQWFAADGDGFELHAHVGARRLGLRRRRGRPGRVAHARAGPDRDPAVRDRLRGLHGEDHRRLGARARQAVRGGAVRRAVRRTSRRTSTPSGGTRASATTARRRAQIFTQDRRCWRWRSSSCR